VREPNAEPHVAHATDVIRALGLATGRTLRARTVGSYARRAVTGHARLGHCPVCSRTVVFIALTDWLRDTYQCLRCGSIPRQRAFMVVLDRVAPDWRKRRIHESSPDGASSRRMAEQCPSYDASQYWPDVDLGSVRDGVQCEDVTRLTFPDESLDVFVSQDVFEHVLSPEAGFAEIARVLRPGGLHIFTVPWYWWKPTLVRARGTATAVQHFQEPEYHANPVDPQGSLVATEWGPELPGVIFQSSGMATTAFAIYDPRQGIVGEFLEVMVSRKPD
jgi:SAM-dependent methyltransferase